MKILKVKSKMKERRPRISELVKGHRTLLDLIAEHTKENGKATDGMDMEE